MDHVRGHGKVFSGLICLGMVDEMHDDDHDGDDGDDDHDGDGDHDDHDGDVPRDVPRPQQPMDL